MEVEASKAREEEGMVPDSARAPGPHALALAAAGGSRITASRLSNAALKFICAAARCGARFSHKRGLEDHGRAKHGHAGLACSVASCDKVFTFSNNRRNHIRTAHQGKFHVCMEEHCDAEFVLKHQLEDHGRAKHGHPKLVCEVCGAATGATYGSISGLKSHKKRHHDSFSGLKSHKKRQHTIKRG